MTDPNAEVDVVDRALAVSSRMDALEDRRAARAQRRVADTIAARLPKPLSAADRAAIASAQARADEVCVAHSKPSRPPYTGETVTAYRLRLLKDWQTYSAKWKDADLSTVDSLADVEVEVYADALEAAYDQPSGGGLYESTSIGGRGSASSSFMVGQVIG